VSWPQDGLPRFVLVETQGAFKMQHGARPKKGTALHRTYAVLDRAFCHQVAFKVRSEDFAYRGRGRDGAIAQARLVAEAKLGELDSGQVAA
jgi:hypothetical protein